MQNKVIRLDSAEQPDYIPHPELNPTGYDTGRRAAPRRARMSFGGFLLLGLLLLASGGYLLWRIANWVSALYTYNRTFSAIAQAALYTLIIAATITGVLCLFFLAFGLFGRMARAGLIDMPGGFAVHTLDIVNGWRRADVRELASGAMQQHYGVQQTLAQQSQYRNVTSYSPSVNYSMSSKTDAARLPDDEGTHGALLLPPGDIPPFDSLLGAGLIGPGPDGRAQPLILGYDESGEPIEGDWKSLYSCGIGGLQGSGKTWTAAYLLSQSALAGARILCCDPHAGDDESLATRIAPLAPSFIADVATDDAAILDALKLADMELQRRKNGSKDRWPLVVVVDEWTSLLRHELKNKLPQYVADFASEGRKYNVNAMLLGQGWTVAAAGGSDVRNRLTSHYVHRTRREEARYQLGLGSLTPADVMQLAPGHAYLLDTRGNLQRVAIPRMTAADLVEVGRRLQATDVATTVQPFGFRAPAKTPATVASCKPDGSQMVANENQATTALGRDEMPTAEAIHAARLFFAGDDPATIVFKLRGIKSNEGRRYQAALVEILDLIRQGALVGA